MLLKKREEKGGEEGLKTVRSMDGCDAIDDNNWVGLGLAFYWGILLFGDFTAF